MAKAQLGELFAKDRSLKLNFAGQFLSRLAVREQTLRKWIVGLICIFIVSLAVAILIISTTNYSSSLSRGKAVSALHADLAAASLGQRLEKDLQRNSTPRILLNDDLERAIAAGGTGQGRVFLALDATGHISATVPDRPNLVGRRLVEIVPHDLDIANEMYKRDMVEVRLASNEPAFVTRRDLSPYPGELVLLQGSSELLSGWWARTKQYGTLFVTTSFVLLLIGAAFHWQTLRADEADRTLDIATARLDKALDRGKCGLWDWDIARGHIFWSKSMYDMLGLEPEGEGELLSYGEVCDRLHPDDQRMDAMVDRMLRSGQKQVDQEFRMRHRNGNWVWLRARAELAQADGEETPHFVGIAIDVTEQKVAARLNQEAELRLRDAIENISEAFVLWDADNQLVMCNSIYQHFHNLPASVCVPGTAYEIVAQAAKEPIVRERIPKNPNDPQSGNTFEAQLEDGRWLHISERRTKDGGFVSVGTDVTPIKEHEEQLLSSEKELMDTVRDLEKTRMEQEIQKQRLAELADSYQEQKARAEAANRSKSEFLANMSHELRTPLNAVIGFSEVMVSELLGPIGTQKYLEYAKDIHGSGQYLLEVISDILDMSKIEAGRVQIEARPAEFGTIIDHAFRIVEPRAKESRISIIRKVEPGITLLADERALKQVLINILTNAVKFTPENGKVTIKAKAMGDELKIAIIDSGIGIPERYIDKLGRPFEQVENQFTKSRGGSGLGLAISRSLVELHGGRLKISSLEGSGTTVAIRIPLLTENQDAQTIEDAPRAIAV
ncbi:MAG: ATP-binding protein [Pseudomonadota bacterium]